jgi:ADP-heptose:LPS heptosyltransferase
MKLAIKQAIDKYIGRFLVLFFIIIVRSFGKLLNRNHVTLHPPENILVVKMMGIGSILIASNSIYSLKNMYPGSKIILVCSKSVKQGIQPIGLFDKIFDIDDTKFHLLIKNCLSTIIKCWKLKQLWVLDLEVYSVLTTIFSVCTLGYNRFGFQLSKVHFRNYLNTHNIYFNQFIPIERNYEQIVKAMGVKEISKFKIYIPIAPQIEKYIAINNTCSELGGHLRKIPDNILALICKHILDSSKYKIAFTGAPSDFNEIENFSFNTLRSSRIANVAGKYSFEDYYSFLKNQCDFMISIDSAPFHMAVKIELPTISLWGPINPMHRFNFENQSKHLYHYLNLNCSPCIHHTEVVPCEGNNICMKNMEIKDILSLIDSHIKSFCK